MTHSLRLSLLFLRIALGLSFCYLGWAALFDRTLGAALRAVSLGGLSAWLAQPAPFAAVPSAAFAWILLVAGACLVIGLFTRIASIVAMALILASVLPGINIASFNPAQLVNEEVVAFFALLVLVFGKAGQYAGLDAFLHFGTRHKK
ncbi:MAG TPA: DoxX family membrane protein [Candidatus Paceibacterota bacterium]|nr:DoxX family membrane protein [Candidatus Paceibacterota bacterium]